MEEELKIGDYFWIDNSQNYNLHSMKPHKRNMLAIVTNILAGQNYIEARIVYSSMPVMCWEDNSGRWSIGKKANVKIKNNPYLTGLMALTNHGIRIGTIS